MRCKITSRLQPSKQQQHHHFHLQAVVNMSHFPLLKLPTELILNILSLCDSLTDFHALSSSCKTLHDILDSKAYDAILSRSLPAFENALRCQRGSVAAIRYMIQFGYDKKHIKPLLPPAHVTHIVHVPRCHFNVQMGRYENVPSEMSIKNLSRTPIGSQ